MWKFRSPEGARACNAVAFEIVIECLDAAQAPALSELELGIFAKA
jgi:hypothetical protein